MSYLYDDFLKANGCFDERQCRVSTAEIMLVPLVAYRYFGANQALARRFLFFCGYVKHNLSTSRFCHRLHAIAPSLWRHLFRLLGEVFVHCNTTCRYVADSLSIPACDNVRIQHCKLFPEEAYRGCRASKRRFFFGLKVHPLVNGQGQPVEFMLTPGSSADIKALKRLDLDLPAGSLIHADRAYTDYSEEDLLSDAAGIVLQPQRMKNSKRPCLGVASSPLSPSANKSRLLSAKSPICFPNTFMPSPQMALFSKSLVFCWPTTSNV
jgi:hypothetical protein